MNPLWIYEIPNWASFLVVVGTTLAVVWIGLYGLRPWVSHLHSEQNHNDVVSYFLAAAVLFYGVMVGLIAVGVWQEFTDTDQKVALEASALSSEYRDASAFPVPYRSVLQSDLRAYTRSVIYEEWPLQRKKITPKTNENLWKYQTDLVAFEPVTNSQIMLQAESFRTYSRLIELRRMRLHNVQVGLPAEVWIVVIIGAITILLFSCFFKTANFAVHFWLGTFIAVLLGSIIWLLVVLDHPFLGRVMIGPDAFERAYQTLMTSHH